MQQPTQKDGLPRVRTFIAGRPRATKPVRREIAEIGIRRQIVFEPDSREYGGENNKKAYSPQRQIRVYRTHCDQKADRQSKNKNKGCLYKPRDFYGDD